MNNTEIVRRSLKKRYAREKRFRLYGRCAVMVGFIFLALLLVDIFIKAMPAFSVTEIQLEIETEVFFTIVEDAAINVLQDGAART